MLIEEIVRELRNQRAKINSAIDALELLESKPSEGNGRRTATGRRRRHMSPAARRRISQAMKQRWAESKRRGKGWTKR